MRCARVAIFAAMIPLVVAAAPARAALILQFEPPEAPPGDQVVARTGGRGAAPDAAGQELSVFLFRADTSLDITRSSDEAVRIGHLAVDAYGDGVLDFVVPDVPAGRYLVHLDCEVCEPDHFPFAGEFVVLGAGSERSLPTIPIVLVAGALAFAVLTFGVRSRFRVRQSQQPRS